MMQYIVLSTSKNFTNAASEWSDSLGPAANALDSLRHLLSTGFHQRAASAYVVRLNHDIQVLNSILGAGVPNSRTPVAT